MQVLNGVHQIKSPCPGDTSWYTNVYVIEGGAMGIYLLTAGGTARNPCGLFRKE